MKRRVVSDREISRKVAKDRVAQRYRDKKAAIDGLYKRVGVRDADYSTEDARRERCDNIKRDMQDNWNSNTPDDFNPLMEEFHDGTAIYRRHEAPTEKDNTPSVMRIDVDTGREEPLLSVVDDQSPPRYMSTQTRKYFEKEKANWERDEWNAHCMFAKVRR